MARLYEDAFRADCAALNIRPPEYLPRASESIDLMLDMIGRLIEDGHAYASAGSVYFDARSFPGYGEISGNSLDELRPGHRSARRRPARASGSTPTGRCGRPHPPAAS